MSAEATDVVPHLPSDPPGRRRPRIPREDALRRLWKRYHLARGAKPLGGAVVAGTLGLGLALEFGVGELLVGLASGYIAYRMLRYGIDLREALMETVQIEKAAEGGA